MSSLLLKFKVKDSAFGVKRETLKAIADEMAVSETMAIHLALARLAQDVLPGYEMDDGPLTKSELSSIRKATEAMMPRGRVAKARSLL